MWLKRLQAQNLRCFSELDLSLSPGINIIFGKNGAGKTSILEAIDVLSRGKSFRSSKLAPIIKTHEQELILFGELENLGNSTLLGIRNGKHQLELKINREKVKQWSLLAKHLPVIDIHPESYLLITGGPSERRKYLNWGVFHVEPSYSKLWTEYCRSLKQRNSCLKSRDIKQAKFWNPTLAISGEKISDFISNYCDKLQPYIKDLCNKFEFSTDVTFEYQPGWSKEESLENLLDQELSCGDAPNSTQYGPHRGDLRINWGNRRFAQISSRGQQKILTTVMKLAQAELLRTSQEKNSVYLIDELPAELDNNHRQLALELLTNLDAQVIISAVSKDSIESMNTETKWFHVEHGSVSPVL